MSHPGRSRFSRKWDLSDCGFFFLMGLFFPPPQGSSAQNIYHLVMKQNLISSEGEDDDFLFRYGCSLAPKCKTSLLCPNESQLTERQQDLLTLITLRVAAMQDHSVCLQLSDCLVISPLPPGQLRLRQSPRGHLQTGCGHSFLTGCHAFHKPFGDSLPHLSNQFNTKI